MKIVWCAHAAFLLEGEGLRIVTDPYMPAELGYRPITQEADIVIRSSSTDLGHCYAETIAGDPTIVTATDIGPDGTTVYGLHITAIPAQESLIHKDVPDDNAMYYFALDGISIAHLGDVGNRLTDEQLAALSGAEVLLVPTGGPPTIDLDDLCDAIDELAPRIVIPMHYDLPGTKVDMLPVTDFTNRFSADAVLWMDESVIELRQESLPKEFQVVVLEPSTI